MVDFSSRVEGGSCIILFGGVRYFVSILDFRFCLIIKYDIFFLKEELLREVRRG